MDREDARGLGHVARAGAREARRGAHALAARSVEGFGRRVRELAVRDLLLERTGRAFRAAHVIRRVEARAHLARDVAPSGRVIAFGVRGGFAGRGVENLKHAGVGHLVDGRLGAPMFGPRVA